MALQKLTLKPGVNREGTSYANENGFYSSDKVRFRSGYAEKIGGWKNIGAYTYDGIARSIWAWVALSGEHLLGIGTSQKFYIGYGTNYYDITPIRTTISATNIVTGAGTPQVTIDITNNEATTGSFFTLTKAYGVLTSDISDVAVSIDISGVTGTFPASGTILIDKEQINYSSISGPVSGVYTLTIPATNGRGVNGTFYAAHLAGATVISLEAITVGGVNFAGEQQAIAVTTNSITFNTTSTTTAASSAGTFYAIFDVNAGGGTYTTNFGWGSGGWGANPWGSSTITTSTMPIRLWSQSNFDQDLIFAPRYGSIYWWTKNISALPRAITLNTQANNQTTVDTAKTVTTAQWISNASSIVVYETTDIDTGCVITGTGIPVGAYVATTWDYSTTVPLIDPTTGSPATLSNAQTTLNGNINASVLSITLTSGTGFPSSDGVIIIGGEQIFYDTLVGNVITVNTNGRGYNGTTATTHNNGDPVYNYTPTEVTVSYAGRHIPVKTLLISTSSSNAFTIAFGATPYDPYNFSNLANFDPLLIRWSDQDNPYEWVPSANNQSGEQRLANGSVIVTVANTRQEILVWTDTALYSMQYVGPPYVFNINLLMDNLSIASQNAAITVNNITYWMGVDRFYQYSGRVETLPCTLRQFIFGDINRAQLAQICCGTNEGFNEVWWFYPSSTSLINDRYVIYNHLEQTWTYGTINRTAWLDTQLEENPLGAFSTERTYLALNVGSTDTSIQLAETSSLPYSGTITIDSEQITYAVNNYANNLLQGCVRGVNNTTAAPHTAYARATFATPNQLMYHEFGYDDGSGIVTLPIEAYIESADFDIGDGMNFAYVWRILPDLTFSGSTVSSPKCQLTVRVRQNSGSAYTTGSTDSQDVTRTATYPIEQYTGQVYTRVRGRQMAFRMSSNTLGVFWQMGMMRIDIRQDGRR
jgi:hypothetical protein